MSIGPMLAPRPCLQADPMDCGGGKVTAMALARMAFGSVCRMMCAGVAREIGAGPVVRKCLPLGRGLDLIVCFARSSVVLQPFRRHPAYMALVIHRGRAM